MEFTSSQMVLLKMQMIQSADKIKAFFQMNLRNKEEWLIFFDQISAYLKLQSDEFYHNLKLMYQGDASVQKKIDFLQADLKYLKADLFECNEVIVNSNVRLMRELNIKQIKGVIVEIKERIDLEENLLRPLMV